MPVDAVQKFPLTAVSCFKFSFSDAVRRLCSMIMKVPKLLAPAERLHRGACILADAPQARPRSILIASGSEVGLIGAAGQKLQEQKIPVRLAAKGATA